jgi:phage FluMu protein Com
MSEAERIAGALKPPKCPHCGKPIDELICLVEEIHEYIYQFDYETKEFETEETEMWTGDWIQFKCPSCDAVLFTDERAAKDFFLSGD